jgi:dTDP-4-amino-4,6-dideoxygalactose transaminase
LSNSPIPFIDLKAQRDRIRDKIDAAIAGVINHGGFIMGKEVGEFEAQLAAFTGARNVITCGNGTDALQLALMAEGIGPGDAVFVPAFTFVATAEAPLLVGAVPVFVDVSPDTFSLDVESLKLAIIKAKNMGLRPRAVIAVDLFGSPAEYAKIRPLAEANGMVVIADSAQSFGSENKGKKTGTLADYTTTSFFPSKPLACYGDGGAVFTDDDQKAALLRSIRVHGKGDSKYDNVRTGMNSRLDTLQAAILIEKLAIFPDEILARKKIAKRYRAALTDVVEMQHVPAGSESAWALFTIKVENREQVQHGLRDAGVPSVVYYPISMNKQAHYNKCPTPKSGVPVSEKLSSEVLSIPIHPYLDDKDQDRIIASLKALL